MWGLTTVVGAFALALVLMSFAFMGGAVIVAVPLALLAVAVALMVDVRRRRNQVVDVQSHREAADSDPVEFTARDRQTLTSE
jgi:hypothetical protein